MIHEKCRNYDVAKKRHHTDMGSIPTNVADLPQSREPDCPRSQEDDGVHKTRDSSSDEGDELEPPVDGARDVEGILGAVKNKTRPGRLAGQEPPIAVTCGVMPPGTGLHDFHAPPSKVHARNAEAVYWRDFGTQVVNVFPKQDDVDVQKAVNSSWGISSLSAVTASESQRLFFKAIDKHQSDAHEPTVAAPTKRHADPYDKAVAAAVQRLPKTYTRSPTVVMEAAFFWCSRAC